MDSTLLRRGLATVAVGLSVLGSSLAISPSVRGGTRHLDPSQIVPLSQIAPEHRAAITEILTSPTFQRQGEADSFPCHPRLYLSLLNEPALTLALWKDLSTSPATLQQIGPDRYQGTDGNGATATWEFVYRSPKLHVLLCDLDYSGPRGNTRLQGRIVLIVRSEYFQRGEDEPWIRHDVEAYVKIDSKGWRAVAKTVRPILERLLEDQVQEAGWFVSLMGRLVEMYPDWARQVAQQGPGIRPDTRQSFVGLIAETRRPGAFTGRPTMAEAPASGTRLR